MSKRFKAAVIGGSGYGGAELIRRLLIHPDVELARIASIDHVDEPIGAVHPNLEGQTELRFENLAPAEAARGCDVALLALPHKVTASKVPELLAAGVKIVDMSGDFRLRDAGEYKEFYGAAHPHPELLGTFVYGLPELNRDAIRKARCVASPGCFATTIELALLPLAKAGRLDRAVIHVNGITGSSGSGIAPGAGTHHPSRAGNLKTYKPLEHQHTPEVVQTLHDAGAKDVSLQFVPVSAPLVRGIFVTAFVEVPAEVDQAYLTGLYDAFYEGAAFVRRPKKRLPEVVAVAGSNYAEIGFHAGPVHGERRTITLFCATDNLIKGGAGQAIQNMNLVLGVDEKASLEDPGLLAVTAPRIVIKIGGEVVASGEVATLAKDLHAFAGREARVAVVHGGGPQATELSKRLGIETRQVGGRRITDDATLDVMKMVLAGKLNVDLCAALLAAGVSPVGLHGASALTVQAVRRPPRVVSGGGPDPIDFGHVGDVIGFNLELLETLLSAGYVPVIACLGADSAGHVYNINADIVGNQLAAAIRADHLFLVTSTPGVLRDVKDPSSRLPLLTEAQARAAIDDGTVSGGMIPKLEEAFSVLHSGVGAIHILGKLGEGDLVRAIDHPGSVGTTLVP